MMDGNEAVAHVAYKVNGVIAIYPITPSSPMAEHCDAWSSAGEKNLWDVVPNIAEMQSEAGASGGCARCPAGRFAEHDLHRQPGAHAHDPQHVQDRRGTQPHLLARHRPLPGMPGSVHLRRSPGCDGACGRPASRCWPRTPSRRRTIWGSSAAPPRSRRGCRSSISSMASAPPTRSRRSPSRATRAYAR